MGSIMARYWLGQISTAWGQQKAESYLRLVAEEEKRRSIGMEQLSDERGQGENQTSQNEFSKFMPIKAAGIPAIQEANDKTKEDKPKSNV